MKRTPKRLSFDKQTLRALVTDQLKAARGGNVGCDEPSKGDCPTSGRPIICMTNIDG